MSIRTAEELAGMQRAGVLVARTLRAQLSRPLGEGLVLAIEPMLGLGGPELVTRDDGWTIATADGSLAAHVEHTVVVAPGGPLVLTT